MDVQFDRASTGKVGIVADWAETHDGGSGTVPPSTVHKSAKVGEAIMAAANSATSQPPPPNQLPTCSEEDIGRKPDGSWIARLHGNCLVSGDPSPKIRHDFGDTRHREVDYSLISYPRFTDCFPNESLKSLPSTKSVKMSILNTAKPPVPDVAWVVPLFYWEDGPLMSGNPPAYPSKRRASGLRIWLKRPWYVTGDGEQLGIVVWDKADVGPGSRNNAENVTRWGADPIWTDDALTHGPSEADLTSPMRESKDTNPVVFQNNMINNTFVVRFNPQFDEENDMYYIDVYFKDVPSYFSFVRLALVRYQHCSIPGCKFSPVAMAQFAQSTPNRAVSISRHLNADGKTSKDTLDVVLSGDLGNDKNLYSIQIQHLWNRPLAKKWWINVGNEIIFEGTPRNNELCHWSLALDGNCAQKRLIVREYETFARDADILFDGTFSTAQATRLVFADVLEI